MQKKRKNQAKILRIFRKVHKSMGAFLFLFFFIISISGGILGWKKNSESILPATALGTSFKLSEWISIDTLEQISHKIIQDSLGTSTSLLLDRIDIRKSKGIVKFIYKNQRIGIQLDGKTGVLLNFGYRNADLIENIHDGSILDNYFGTNGIIKLIYSSLMSIALLFFTITGFWLWFGPKRMRKSTRQNKLHR